jgi:hypothetical protein
MDTVHRRERNRVWRHFRQAMPYDRLTPDEQRHSREQGLIATLEYHIRPQLIRHDDKFQGSKGKICPGWTFEKSHL